MGKKFLEVEREMVKQEAKKREILKNKFENVTMKPNVGMLSFENYFQKKTKKRQVFNTHHTSK